MTRGARLIERQDAMRSRVNNRKRPARWKNRYQAGVSMKKPRKFYKWRKSHPLDYDKIRRRIAARQLLKTGWRPADIAREFGWPIDAVVRWKEAGCPIT